MYTSAIIFAEICFFWVNGFLLQWGYVSSGVRAKTLDYPIEFSVVPTVVVGMLNYLGNSDYYGVGVDSVTTSSFRADVRDARGCAWIAIGY